MEAKGSAGLVIAIIIFIILIIGGGIAVYFGIKSGYFTNPEDSVNNTMKLIINAEDTLGNNTDGNYILSAMNETIISEGKLESGELREIMIPYEPVQMRCWADGYYLRRGVYIPNEISIADGIDAFSCPMEKIDNDFQITHKIAKSNDKIILLLNISANDYLQKVHVAIGWTSGFKKVYAQEDFIICEGQVWRNWTTYNASTLSYDYLPENEYLCDERIELCEFVEATKCKPIKLNIPKRFKSTHDDVYYSGVTLDGDSITIPFIVELNEYGSRFDEVYFTVFDRDRRFNPEENLWTWFDEYENKDLGAKDKEYIINYGEFNEI